MRMPRRVFDAWFGYGAYVTERGLRRFDRFSEEVAAREYDTSKMLCDVIEMWQDATMGAWAAALSYDDRLPMIFFHLKRSSTCSETHELPVLECTLPDDDPEVAYLEAVHEGDEREIHPGVCKVCLDPDRDLLVTKLAGLKPTKGDLLVAGTYRGLIHVGEVAVADLVVRISDQPNQTARTRAYKMRKSRQRYDPEAPCDDDDSDSGPEPPARAAARKSAKKKTRTRKAPGRRRR